MKKILVAYDGGEAALKALNTAADLAQALGATVSVVSVVPVHGEGPRPGDEVAPVVSVLLAHPDTERAADRRVRCAHGLITFLVACSRAGSTVGEPAPTIERIAREGEFDTIILGSRHLNALERVLQGSVSEHVATHADATVVVVR